MGLESATYIEDLNASNPDGDLDAKSQGDDHLKLIKSTIKATFPKMNAPLGKTNVISGTTLLTATQNNQVFRVTASATVTLPAVAGLHNGWKVTFIVLASVTLTLALTDGTLEDAMPSNQVSGHAAFDVSYTADSSKFSHTYQQVIDGGTY